MSVVPNKLLTSKSLPALRAQLAVWKQRKRVREARLAKLRKIRTSNTPRTKLAPERKIELLAQYEHDVRVAQNTLVSLNEAIAWKQLPLRLRALAISAEYEGVLEEGGNNRGERVEEIIRANGGVPGEAWCADFDACCYKKAGSAAVTRAWAAVRNLGFLAGMQRLASRLLGLPGDIVCYTFDHTGLLIHYCNAQGQYRPAHQATHVKVREGNTGLGGAASDSRHGVDGVHTRIRPLSLVSRVVRVKR